MTFIYILFGIVLLIILLGLIAPKNYEVSRTIVIERDLKDVFQYLKLVKNQDDWSPWKKKDPNMVQSSIGTDGEVGFISKWKGNKDVGEGEQEIINITENESIDSQLRFFKPWKSESIAHILVDTVDDDKTVVTWGFAGKNKFTMSIFMLFMNLDKMVGKDFEEGLASLKQILEKN
ncbi:MAG: SRPBCC family protein [Flavobacteriaceae bacterium]|nr:SRPBCC family protein [Flavobacteriaceae bacterium]